MKKLLFGKHAPVYFFLIFLFSSTQLSGEPFQWKGTDSKYNQNPKFLLIRDLPTFTIFWRKHGNIEEMPYIDFSQDMIFAFCPGKTRQSYDPCRVDKFFIENGVGIILLDIERRKVGGYSRSPYLIAVLPKFDTGEIYVARYGNWQFGKRQEVPMFCFGTWGGQYVKEFAFRGKNPKQVTQFLTTSLPKDLYKEPPPAATKPGSTFGATENKPVFLTQSPPKPPAQTAPPTTVAQTAKPTEATDKSAFSSSMGDFSSDPFGGSPATPSTKTKAQSQPQKRAETPPKKDLLSDPFQDEFDIEF